MRLLDKLRGQRTESPTAIAPDEAPVCAHVTLVPHWDSAADMGDHSKVSSWTCDACGATLSPAAVRSLRATEADRLREQLSTN